MDDYRSRIQSADIDALFQAFLSLRSVTECYRFFEDICTITEIQSLAQRWEVAMRLDRGETYQDIAKSLNVSTATISRVNRCLAYGAGGYRLLLDRRSEEKGTE